MSELLKRIHGTEMEWSIVPPKGISTEDCDTVFGAHLKKYKETHPNAGSHYGDGKKLYHDVGNHWECDTPENDSFLDTVACEIAGERTMYEVLTTPIEDEFIIRDGRNNPIKAIPTDTTDYYLQRRVIDDDGNTWGYHRSMAVRAEAVINAGGWLDTDKLALLALFNATRGIFFGAGWLDNSGTYHISQKIRDVGIGFAPGTTSPQNKPLVNTRDEALANRNLYRRIHDTSSDANMSPWATRVGLGAASLVLRLIENEPNQIPSLKILYNNLPFVAKHVSKDLSLKKRFRLSNGEGISAIDAQRKIINKVRCLTKTIVLPDEELWALEEWDKACSELKQDPILLEDRADWATKLRILKNYKEKSGVAWDSNVLRAIDRNYSNLGKIDLAQGTITDKGIGVKLRESLWPQYMPSEELINERMNNPPQTTRAKIRGETIQKLFGVEGVEMLAEWDYITIAKTTVHLGDPRKTQSKRVDDLVAKALRKANSKVA